MNKNRFFEKNKWLGIPQEELERMWLILKEQLNLQGMAETLGFGAGGGGSVSSGSQETLTLTFDSISNVTIFIPNPLSVAQWNAFFNLPALGQPFTSVSTSGNSVLLKGGSGIKLKPDLMYPDASPYIIEVVDTGCVTGVGGGALASCTQLTTVDLPVCTVIYDASESLLGYGALSNNPVLSIISMPSLATAGSFAFYGSNMSTLTLPQLTIAGDNCFDSCLLLTTANLVSLETAGFQCFNGCSGLSYINAPSLTQAASLCFSGCSGLLTLDFPLLGSAGAGCFSNMSSLSSVALPSLVSCGINGFLDCANIQNLTLPLLEIASDSIFSGCSSLSSVDLPSVTTIGDNAFLNCFVLNSVQMDAITVLPANVFTSIGFSLQNVSMAELVDLAGGSFSGFVNLTTVNMPKVETIGVAAFNASGIINPEFPALRSIGSTAFAACPGIQSFFAPNVETMGDSCFTDCVSLLDVNFPLVTAVPFECFKNCTSLSSVSMPGAITASNLSFKGCVTLNSVSMPLLQSAGDYCFADSALVVANFTNLQTVNASCFQSCVSLNIVDLPSATYIGPDSFYLCNALEYISIPSCLDLGGSVGDNNVFLGVASPWTPNPGDIPVGDYQRDLIVPEALTLCNSGAPDGDILYLIANNPALNIITV